MAKQKVRPLIYTLHDEALREGWDMIGEASMSHIRAFLKIEPRVTEILQLENRFKEFGESGYQHEPVYNERYLDNCLVMTKEPIFGDFRDTWCLQIHPPCRDYIKRILNRFDLSMPEDLRQKSKSRKNTSR